MMKKIKLKIIMLIARLQEKIKREYISWVRKTYVSNEVRPGRMAVCWRDVDNVVYGWNMPADEEAALLVVSQLIRDKKLEKLKEIIEA